MLSQKVGEALFLLLLQACQQLQSLEVESSSVEQRTEALKVSVFFLFDLFLLYLIIYLSLALWLGLFVICLNNCSHSLLIIDYCCVAVSLSARPA
jgi:hypothetical protein